MSNPSPENIHSSMLPPVDTKEDKPRKRSKFQKLIITRDFQQGRRNPGRVGRRGGNVKSLQGRRIVSECRCVFFRDSGTFRLSCGVFRPSANRKTKTLLETETNTKKIKNTDNNEE